MRATWHGTTCSNLSPENQRGRQDRLTAGRGRTACEERGQGHSGPESAPALHPPEAGQPGLHAPRPRPPPPSSRGRRLVSRLGTETPNVSLRMRN